MRRVLAERTMNQVISLPHADPGTPDLTSPTAYLRWVGKGQWRTLVVAIAFGIVWLVSQALFPAAMGKAIDKGIIGGDAAGSLLLWCGILIGLVVLSALSGAMRHKYAVANWMQGAFRSAQLIGHKAADTGEALTRTVPTGDVVATVSSDAMRIGGLYDVAARFAGAVVSYVVVALILLQRLDPLGLVVLIGVPVLVACLTFIVRPLQARQLAQREESGTLIGLGADTVAGLRVLRGIGGEQTFLRRYAVQSQSVRQVGNRVAGYQAALDAAQVLLPGIFVLVVVWLGARFAIDGQITAGQLVAFYGYTAFLVIPLRTATEMVDRATRAHIGARKLTTILRVEPDDAETPRRRSRCRPARPRSTTRAAASRSSRAASPSWCRRVPRRPRRWPTGSAASEPGRPTCGSTGRASPTPPWRRSVAGSSSPRPTPGSSPAPCAPSSTRGATTTTPRSSRPSRSRAATTCSRRCPAGSTTRSRSAAGPSPAASASASP